MVIHLSILICSKAVSQWQKYWGLNTVNHPGNAESVNVNVTTKQYSTIRECLKVAALFRFEFGILANLFIDSGPRRSAFDI